MAASVVLEQFLRTSTIKGVSRASQSNNVGSKILWISSLIFGIGVGGYFAFGLFTQFWGHYHSTGTSEKEGYAPFPAVTLCNMNPLAYYEDSSVDFKKVLQDVDKLKQEVRNDTSILKSLKREQIFVLSRIQSYGGFFQNADSHYTNEELDPRRLITFCSFVGSLREHYPRPCKSLHVKHMFLNSNSGSCFTFDPRRINMSRSSLGTVTSLHLVIYLNEFFSVPNPDFFSPISSGVKLILHEPGVLPSDTDSISLSPGTLTKIVIAPVFRSRLPQPYTSCEQRKFINETIGSYHFHYSQEGCFQACRQTRILDQCKCVDASLFSTKQQRSQYNFCSNTVKGLKNIMDNLRCKFRATNRKLCEKPCPLICEEYQYKVRSFSSKWPSPVNQMAFYEKQMRNKWFQDKFSIYENISKIMNKDHRKGFSLLQSTDLITRNFLQVKVAFGRPVTIYMVDKPVITLASFLGGLGGIFNLWIGLSFITLIEILDLLISILKSSSSKNLKDDIEKG